MAEDEGTLPRRRRWAEVWDDWLVGRLSLADWLLRSIEQPDAFPAYLNALFALVLALFAFLAWIDAKDTAKQTREQLDILKGAQRPWVYVDDVQVVKWRHDPNDSDALAAILHLNLTNSGSTPGVHTYVYAELLNPLEKPDRTFDFDHRCHVETSPKPSGGRVVFPKTPTGFDMTVYDDSKKRNDDALRTVRKRGIYIKFCIRYYSPVDGKPHLTTTNYAVQLRPEIDASAREITADDVELSTSTYHGGEAD